MVQIRILLPALMTIAFLPAHAQDQRQVREPVIPPVCSTLNATNAWPLDETRSDTARIQAALDSCSAGHAVELKSAGSRDSFLSGPLNLRSGVTLLVDGGVTLYGSRDPADYALQPGGCGIITEKGHGCRALINGEGLHDAGIMGDGVIDGRGGAKIGSGDITWWQLADKARAGGSQNNPRILVLDKCTNFTLYRITLRNSANFHVYFSNVNGFTAWGVKIYSPKRARNTDGIDPANSTNVTITQSWIDTGDDNVAIKAGGTIPSTHMTISHNHFYSGHGMSIGSETDAGASAIRVSDLSIEGADNGIRIKSNSSRGGLVRDIVYEDVCIRDTEAPLLFDTHYPGTDKRADLSPRYEDITLRNVHIDSSGKAGAGKFTFDSFDAAHPLGITFDGLSISRTPTAACKAKFQPFPAPATPLRVAADGSGDFTTVQQALDASHPGATILVAPGTYREKVVVRAPHIEMRGAGVQAADTAIVLDQSAGSTGSTFRSSTVEIRAADFRASNITFANDFNRTHEQTAQGSQALALFTNADRGVYRGVRLLGNQDTLYAASENCNPDGNPCAPTRQYFADCYIEGNVDFIFGDGKAYFDRCEIHSTAHQVGYITAQGKHYAEEESGFVFRNCTLTAAPGVANVFLGRPWRAFASVTFLDTTMGSQIDAAGWREWHPGETNYLQTVSYAEFASKGPAGSPKAREPHTKMLTASEAAAFLPERFLAGADGWSPWQIK